MTKIPFVFQNKNMPLILGRLGFLRLLSFGKIIDVGCGLGTTFGGNATNLDKIPNEEMIELVEKQDEILYMWFKALFPNGKTEKYIQADATKHIPFDDKSFDCAVLSEVLEHLDEEETNDMLKESGRVADYVIISVPNEWEWPDYLAFNKNVCHKESGHKSFHTQDSIIKAVETAGLNVLLYLKVNIELLSHHVLMASNKKMVPINYRWGVGYGINGATTTGMQVTADEIISYLPLEKFKILKEKKLNTE